MATEFNPEQLKAHLAKLDDYEIERRIERKMWEGERLKVAQKILKEKVVDLDQRLITLFAATGRHARAHHALEANGVPNARSDTGTCSGPRPAAPKQTEPSGPMGAARASEPARGPRLLPTRWSSSSGRISLYPSRVNQD